MRRQEGKTHRTGEPERKPERKNPKGKLEGEPAKKEAQGENSQTSIFPNFFKFFYFSIPTVILILCTGIFYDYIVRLHFYYCKLAIESDIS